MSNTSQQSFAVLTSTRYATGIEAMKTIGAKSESMARTRSCRAVSGSINKPRRAATCSIVACATTASAILMAYTAVGSGSSSVWDH